MSGGSGGNSTNGKVGESLHVEFREAVGKCDDVAADLLDGLALLCKSQLISTPTTTIYSDSNTLLLEAEATIIGESRC